MWRAATMSETRAFWIDTEDDRESASDRVSRYGAYVRMAAFEPYTDDGQAVELAIFAWERATGPVMAPGYVREHHRVSAARLHRSDWDGSLLARVDLVMPQPPHLRWMRTDEERGFWRDWPSQRALSGLERFYEPDSDELARDPYLLTTASLRFTVPSGDLPQPPYVDLPNVRTLDALALVETCKQSVTVLVRELNAIVGPVIDRIEGT
jgi:hypothetical protein